MPCLLLSRPQRRRARRRRHGRADRRASRQRRRSGRAVRPAGEGGRPERHRQQGASTASRSSSRRRSRAKDRAAHIEAANYDARPRAARRVRPRDRGDRRAHGLEARPLREDRAASRAARDLRVATRRGCRSTRSPRRCPRRCAPRFCGIHFFNPPRYMHLVELIAAPATDPALLDALETFLVTTLGKGVIRAKDTPNFIANRVGVFSMLATMHAHAALRPGLRRRRRADRSGDRPREERDLPHRRRGRPRHDGARHQDDARHAARRSVASATSTRRRCSTALIAQGRARAEDEGRLLPQGRQGHPGARPGRARLSASRDGVVDPAVAEILDDQESRREVRASCARIAHPQAQFLWAIFRDLFHYCAYHLAAIADNARDVDLAIRWGFGWAMGPFEIWQAAGWKEVAGWIAEDIAAGKALANVPLPEWVSEGPAAAGVHTPAGAYAPAANVPPALDAAGVRRQRFPDPVLGERVDRRHDDLRDRRACACGTSGDDIAIVSFKSKMNTIGEDVLDGVHARDRRGRARMRGPRDLADEGAVLARREPGGDRARRSKAGQWDVIEAVVAQVPADVAAPALQPRADRRGGARHGARRLVRVHPALRPHGRGARVLHRPASRPAWACCRPAAAARSSRCARRRRCSAAPVGGQLDQFPFLRTYFQTVAMAKVAQERAARRRSSGFLRAADVVVMQPVRAAARRDGRGARAGRGRLPAAAAAAQRPGRRPHRHRDARDDARQHARRRLHLGVRLRGRPARSRACCAAARSSRAAWSTSTGCSSSSAREFMALLRNAKTQARIAHTLEDRQAAAQLSRTSTP